jgi:hypothetical protein
LRLGENLGNRAEHVGANNVRGRQPHFLRNEAEQLVMFLDG